jgi:sugar phosphate permease
MLFGPDNLIAGAIGQDLGGPRAASTAVGIINGVGSIGAILQGVFTVTISARYGWSALFVTLPVLAITASMLALVAVRLATRTPQRT